MKRKDYAFDKEPADRTDCVCHSLPDPAAFRPGRESASADGCSGCHADAVVFRILAFLTGLWTCRTLLGDAGGFARSWDNVGLSFGIQDTNEVFGNVTGGIKTGAAYDGVMPTSVYPGTQQAFGWEGGTFNVSAWNIRGRSLNAYNLLVLQTVSEISWHFRLRGCGRPGTSRRSWMTEWT